MSGMRRYECEFYSVDAPARSCLFCEHCTDVFWDYTNGPYMFLCDVNADVEAAFANRCGSFEEEANG